MRTTFLAAALTVAVLVGAAPAVASGIPAGRYAIGDSVMLGAKAQLQAHSFVVDAVKSRQFYSAVSIVKRKKRHGLLRQKIVIHLGTNGVLIQPGDCDKIARLAGSSRRVYLVTVTGPTRYPKIMKVQNTRMRACAARHGNTHLIDWYKHSRGHGNWFYDKMHLTPKGRKAYASFLYLKSS
ncbi:MAG TPA: hypothetical protein VJ736_02875 [Actinomycetota bacterium]|nr:hypothetical protein [Actinomycetota bacterium]